MHTASFWTNVCAFVYCTRARASDCLAQAALTGLRSLSDRDAVHAETSTPASASTCPDTTRQHSNSSIT